MRPGSASLLIALAAGCAVPLSGAQSPAATFLLARELADEGRVEEALARLEPLMRAVPADPYLRLERAGVLLRAGRLDEASAAVAAARALAADEPDVLRMQGRVEGLRAERDDRAAAVAREALERLRELQPGDLETLVALGQLYLAVGDAVRAVETLSEAARLRPGHAGIEALLARALAVQAEADRRSTARRGSDAAEDPLERADRLSAEGRHGEALQALESLPPEHQGTAAFRRRLALELFLAGELDRASEVAAENVGRWPEFDGGRLLLARIEVALGRFSGAAEALAPLLAAAPVPQPVADLQIRVLEGLGRVDEAAGRLQSDVERRQADGDAAGAELAALDLAELWARHGRWQEAHEAARGAAASSRVDVAREARLVAASALGRLGRHDEGLEVLGAQDPERPQLAARRIGLLLDAGREPQAREELGALLAARPDADVAVAGVMLEHERPGDALPLLERAAQRAPDSLDVSFRLAIAYERLGRVESSVDVFRRVVENAPDFAPALNYLGYLWIERSENLDQALALVDRAVRLDPDNGAYVDSLGWGYYRLGRFSDAVTTLERASRLLPADATVLEHLGDAHLAAGDRTSAADAYRRAVRASGRGDGEAARKLARLEGES